MTRDVCPFPGRVSTAAALALTLVLGANEATAAEPFAFQAQPPIPIGSNVTSIAVGDFDRNGKLDLAVAFNSGGVSVILGNGDGTFQSPVAYPIAGFVESVAVADFNRDGNPDLVVSSWYGTINTVSVFLGNGNGTFESPIQASISLPPPGYGHGSAGALAVGDFNNDGIPDVAVMVKLGWPSPNDFAIMFPGNGDGTFGSQQMYAVGPGVTEIVTSDLNRDGSADLAVANYGCGDVHCAVFSVSTSLGNGNGTFQEATSYPTTGSPISLAVADINSDGIGDIVASGVILPDGGPAPATYYLSTLSGVGDGTFMTAVPYPLTFPPRAVAIEDFDRDGKPDVAVVGSNWVAVLRGSSDGTLQPPQNIPIVQDGGLFAIVVGDFNHDDKPDIALTDFANGVVVVLINLSGDRLFSDGFEGQ